MVVFSLYAGEGAPLEAQDHVGRVAEEALRPLRRRRGAVLRGNEGVELLEGDIDRAREAGGGRRRRRERPRGDDASARRRRSADATAPPEKRRSQSLEDAAGAHAAPAGDAKKDSTSGAAAICARFLADPRKLVAILSTPATPRHRRA